MGDANREIAFGATATAVISGVLVGAASHALDSTGPTARNAAIAGLLGGAMGTVYFWRQEKKPGSWVNPVVTETLPAAIPSADNPTPVPATSTVIVANSIPPTPLGTTVAVVEMIGTVAAGIAAVAAIVDWQRRKAAAQ